MRKDGMESELSRFLEAWFGVRQLIQAGNFNRFHQQGLSATQFMTLNLLPGVKSAVPMGEVARQLNLKPATVAQTINSLEERGLVERQQGESDRRQVLVRITAEGERLKNTASDQFKGQMAAIFRGMNTAKRMQLIAGLEEFVATGQKLGATLNRQKDAVPPAERSWQ